MNETPLEGPTADFYRDVMRELEAAGIEYLVGGSFAYTCYTGIAGRTKDLDLYVRPSDVDAALSALADAGFDAGMHAPTWIAKATRGEDLVDIIFGSSNGVARVDDAWFEHATQSEALGRQVRLIPIEEMIWSKGFVMERDRFDGGDVVHLMHAAAGELDGDRLLRRFADHWRVLLAHLVLFDYAFPSERHLVDAGLRHELLRRATREADEPPPEGRLCFGAFLSQRDYTRDLEEGQFIDARGR